MHDTVGARRLLGGPAYFVPRLKKLWADAAYRGKELADWRRKQGDGWEIEVVEREPGTRGFAVLPRRWVVERSLAWLSRNRRLAKRLRAHGADQRDTHRDRGDALGVASAWPSHRAAGSVKVLYDLGG